MINSVLGPGTCTGRRDGLEARAGPGHALHGPGRAAEKK